MWFAENRYELIENKSQNGVFVKKLMLTIAENIPVTSTYLYGRFPLMLAAFFDDTDSILALIKKGADVNQDNFGWTALHHATYDGNMNACETLLENGANINAVDHKGWTPLMYAANFGKKNHEAYKFLIEKGADKTLRNHANETASQLYRFQE